MQPHCLMKTIQAFQNCSLPLAPVIATMPAKQPKPQNVKGVHDMKRRWNCRYDHQAKIMDNKGNCIEERKLTFTANWKQYNMAAESNDIAV